MKASELGTSDSSEASETMEVQRVEGEMKYWSPPRKLTKWIRKAFGSNNRAYSTHIVNKGETMLLHFRLASHYDEIRPIHYEPGVTVYWGTRRKTLPLPPRLLPAGLPSVPLWPLWPNSRGAE